MANQAVTRKNSDYSSPIVRVGRNFQVTIPAEIRRFVPLVEGDYIKTSTSQGQIIFCPVTVVAKRSGKDRDEREWDALMAKNFLEGYDRADSAYDNL
ncbi:MAG: AbrB/MazE/SpoVT family DNA-binding domain-containing protein [Candidatus Uhrbacteria bacterium]|nr:AbrB/MazE/SpoVT family DNA-binding domain-containing protein [Candidatus Uhrbacteria bacterium]